MEETTGHDEPRAADEQEQDTDRMAELVEAFTAVGRWAADRAARQRPTGRGGRLR